MLVLVILNTGTCYTASEELIKATMKEALEKHSLTQISLNAFRVTSALDLKSYWFHPDKARFRSVVVCFSYLPVF